MKFLAKKWFIRPYNDEYEILYLGDDDILHAADIVPYGEESMSLELARHLVKIHNNYLESLEKTITGVNVCGSCGNIDDSEDEFCSSCRRVYNENDYRSPWTDPKEELMSEGDSFEINLETGESRTVKSLNLKVGNEYELSDGRIVRLRSEAGCGIKKQWWGKVANSGEEMWFNCYGESIKDESIRIINQVAQGVLEIEDKSSNIPQPEIKVGQIWKSDQDVYYQIERLIGEFWFARKGGSFNAKYFSKAGMNLDGERLIKCLTVFRNF